MRGTGEKDKTWLTSIWRKIRWNEGDLLYIQLNKILQPVNINHTNFYAQGQEKCNYLVHPLSKTYSIWLSKVGDSEKSKTNEKRVYMLTR